MVECGFVKSEAESNLYIMPSLFLILYVDDILIFSHSLGKAKEIQDLLCAKYKMTDLGEVQEFLGLQVVRNRTKREVFLHQTKYVENFLKIFGLQSSNSVSIPLDHQCSFQ